MKPTIAALLLVSSILAGQAARAADKIRWECTANSNYDDVPDYGQPHRPAEKLYIALNGGDYYVVGNYPNHSPGLRVKLVKISQSPQVLVLRYSTSDMQVEIRSEAAIIFYMPDPSFAYNCVRAAGV